MRILFSLTYYSPYISGLTLYVKRLADQLHKRGYRCTVITFQHDKALSKREVINGVEIVRVRPLVRVSKGFISFGWVDQCWALLRRNECVVVSLPQVEGVIPAFLGRLLGKRVITIYHCEVMLPAGLINQLIEFVLTVSHVITLSLSHEIITYTQDFALHSKILPIFKKKLMTIYPPIYIPKINKRVQEVLSKKIKGNNFVIGIAARLAAEKGIEYLFEAIPLLKDKFQISNRAPTGRFQIVVAGPLEPAGEKEYKKKIMRLVEKYKNYVVFLGELKHEELGAFYSLLDVLVLPSINSTEAFGMVQVEAMMMGVPVVATDLPGVRVPIQKTGMGIIVPPKNSQKLSEAIVEVLSNKKKYVKDSLFIKKEFSIEKTIDFYLHLFATPAR